MSNKHTPRIVGALFITGTVAGILSAVIANPILGDSQYLAKIAQNETPLLLGSLLVLIMGFSLAMIPVVLFPVFRKYNEALALGAVLFRGALETILYIAVALCWMLLVSAAQNPVGAAAIGGLLQSAEDWIVHLLAITFSMGAFMVYGLFYISKLIPRWLSVWGLVGAVLYLVVPLLAIFGLDQFGALMAPLGVQEMVLAVWLIVRGFSRAE